MAFHESGGQANEGIAPKDTSSTSFRGFATESWRRNEGTSRACVECFFGRLERVFRILRDDAFRLAWDMLEHTVVLCVAIPNSGSITVGTRSLGHLQLSTSGSGTSLT